MLELTKLTKDETKELEVGDFQDLYEVKDFVDYYADKGKYVVREKGGAKVVATYDVEHDRRP